MSAEALPAAFDELAIIPPLLRAISEVGYETPSPIQAKCIPCLLQGRDLLGQAQTGTGKTAAFALPILSRLDLSLKEPQALVLAPTRELAIQVAEAFHSYARHLEGFHVLPIYGGQSMDIQLRQLRRGVHVIVGTPGRIIDHLKRRSLSFEKLATLVLDEADEMLKMGFIEDVEWIIEQTPHGRQIALFSATMPEAIRKVARRHLREPEEIKIHTRTATVEAVTQLYWLVSGIHKLDALTRILEVEDFDAMLVFVRTKTATEELAEKLEARGYAAAALNGDMNQALREKTVERLRNKALDILVATDVAARGLDVERISHVVNYDIPYDTEAYIHRIGRTGRAGRPGSAILFVSPRERRMLGAIEKATRQKIKEMQLPTHQDIADRRIEQFKQMVTGTLEKEELSFYRQLVQRLIEERDLLAVDVASALTFLIQRERPLLVSEKSREESTLHGDATSRKADKTPRRRDTLGADRVLYRIEVGREHGVNPKDIVGAIANEAGIPGKQIGHIKLYDSFSTVDLPAGLPSAVLKKVEKIRVLNQALRIRKIDEGEYLMDQAATAPARNRMKGGTKSELRPPRSGAKRKS
jgi:ATP-dependent RNA helicase DeaD